MNALKEQRTYAQLVLQHAAEAKAAFNALTNDEKIFTPLRASVAMKGLADFISVATEAAVILDRRMKERQAIFDASPVLQAVVSWNDQARKIVVAKPDGYVDEPFISEGFYNAIRANWKMPDNGEIVSCEDYDIVVIDAKRKIKAVIGRE